MLLLWWSLLPGGLRTIDDQSLLTGTRVLRHTVRKSRVLAAMRIVLAKCVTSEMVYQVASLMFAGNRGKFRSCRSFLLRAHATLGTESILVSFTTLYYSKIW